MEHSQLKRTHINPCLQYVPVVLIHSHHFSWFTAPTIFGDLGAPEVLDAPWTAAIFFAILVSIPDPAWRVLSSFVEILAKSQKESSNKWISQGNPCFYLRYVLDDEHSIGADRGMLHARLWAPWLREQLRKNWNSRVFEWHCAFLFLSPRWMYLNDLQCLQCDFKCSQYYL